MLIKKLQPFGLLIIANDSVKALDDIDATQLLALAREHKFIVLREFNDYKKEELLAYTKKLGSLLAWDFGEVMEMKVQEEPKNYLFTHAHVPLHWDGAFHQEPRFLFFHCIQAPHAEAGGETVFVDTESVWQSAAEEQRQAWREYTIRYKTEKLAHYGGEIEIPLVQKHPVTAKTILRFAEPVDTELNPVTAEVSHLSSEQSQRIIHDLAARCYKHQYAHSWQANDYLIADNFALVHGRNAFKTFSPRHLRRIQILQEHQQ